MTRPSPSFNVFSAINNLVLAGGLFYFQGCLTLVGIIAPSSTAEKMLEDLDAEISNYLSKANPFKKR